MTTVLLVRHARTTANSAGVLAGWTDGVGLDDTGRTQAQRLAERLSPVPISEILTSPLQRCAETLAPLLAARPALPVTSDDRVGEVHYGEWTGRELKTLAKEPLWKVVQGHPSGAVFPGGEGLAAMQARAVAAVRERIAASPDGVILVCSHGDVIKALLADALGMHLDSFQRIVVDPASVSVVHYAPTRPFVARMNDSSGDLTGVGAPPPKRSRRRRGEADVGGGAGA